jgi:inhibitor of KinA sporulation pathway (predicted exonuclease)
VTTTSHENDTDLLVGLGQIGKHIGMTFNQAKHRAATGDIPTFKIGKTVCARKSTLKSHFDKLEGSANDGSCQQ